MRAFQVSHPPGRRSGLVLLISDFLSEDDFRAALKFLRRRGQPGRGPARLPAVPSSQPAVDGMVELVDVETGPAAARAGPARPDRALPGRRRGPLQGRRRGLPRARAAATIARRVAADGEARPRVPRVPCAGELSRTACPQRSRLRGARVAERRSGALPLVVAPLPVPEAGAPLPRPVPPVLAAGVRRGTPAAEPSSCARSSRSSCSCSRRPRSSSRSRGPYREESRAAPVASVVVARPEPRRPG